MSEAPLQVKLHTLKLPAQGMGRTAFLFAFSLPLSPLFLMKQHGEHECVRNDFYNVLLSLLNLLLGPAAHFPVEMYSCDY